MYGPPYQQPNYGYRPVAPIYYPPVTGAPGGPYVMKPVPLPGPILPPSGPGSQPTTPISNPTQPTPTPTPNPPTPSPDQAWSPWPLPPKVNLVAENATGVSSGNASGVTSAFTMNDEGMAATQPITTVAFRQASDGATTAADRTLKYRGGHTIADLAYVNLYVSGDTAWQAADVERIEKSLAAAMSDERLNGVLKQYFQNRSITSTALPPHPLVGYVPEQVTRGDIENYMTHLFRQGYLKNYDLRSTAFNLLLPPKTILSDRETASHTRQVGTTGATAASASSNTAQPVDSTMGLAGYHGSVDAGNGQKIYFAVSVFSDRHSNGQTNGIPVFAEAWKNATATLYHQLMEVRTDPDVEDALRKSTDLNSGRILGWVTDAGLEIGDVFEDQSVPVTSIIREVPLANGSGVVPVQLPYSNATGRVEGAAALQARQPTSW